jgi:hypothetical protein
MNTKDAARIVWLVVNHAEAQSSERKADVVRKFLAEAEGTPGNGKCICRASPEERQKHAERMGTTLAAMGTNITNILLDHRCPHHGEKAQPAIWGRHKEKELLVTPAQWLSLGVTRP